MSNILLFHAAFILEDYQNLSEYLSEINNTIITARKNGDRIYSNALVGEVETKVGFPLNQLAWQNIHEIKKVLPSFTNDAQKILLGMLKFNETPLCSSSIGEINSEFVNAHNGVLGFLFDPSVNTDLEITTEETWYNFHRQYFVSHVPTRQDFISEISPFFPNLHFSLAVPSGLSNFEGTDYNRIIKTIIYHLSALNDDFVSLFSEYRNQGADKVCEKLTESFAAKKISLSATREKNGIEELKFTFLDASGKEKKIDCNLHTKFESFFEIDSPNHSQKGNRIYFLQPDDKFIEGKVLIGRIGKHRNTGFH